MCAKTFRRKKGLDLFWCTKTHSDVKTSALEWSVAVQVDVPVDHLTRRVKWPGDKRRNELIYICLFYFSDQCLAVLKHRNRVAGVPHGFVRHGLDRTVRCHAEAEESKFYHVCGITNLWIMHNLLPPQDVLHTAHDNRNQALLAKPGNIKGTHFSVCT